MKSDSLLISGLQVYTDLKILPSAAVLIQDHKIVDILSEAPASFSGRHLKFPSDFHLLPGRIDLHIHGAQGADIMDASPLALEKIRTALAEEGVTGFLATTLTESPEKIEQALQNIKNFQENPYKNSGAEILGIHLEGPFISPKHIGAHRGELILTPDVELLNRWQNYAGGHIKMVTLAPELPGGFEFIRHLIKQNIIPAIGHTDADFAATQLAITAGAHYATHLFNAMRPFHHREPGCIAAILLDDRVMAEIIADGCHCHPAAINLVLKMKGIHGFLLVTDAMRAKCCPTETVYDLGGQEVVVQEGAVRLKNGTLAGSVLTMTQAVKNMLRFTDCTLMDLIQLTSTNPARILQLDHCKGSITRDKDADMIVLDNNLDVMLTVCQGQILFNKSLCG